MIHFDTEKILPRKQRSIHMNTRKQTDFPARGGVPRRVSGGSGVSAKVPQRFRGGPAGRLNEPESYNGRSVPTGLAWSGTGAEPKRKPEGTGGDP